MLKKLSIRHFAIIDELDLEFKPGLNILSGETGAGKSILIQALGLILGERGYSELIRSGEDECEVTAEFDVSKIPPSTAFFSKYAASGPLTVRRMLQRSGKGRAWINDQGASIGELETLGRLLMDLVSQHESQGLLSEDKPRIFLDDFGGHGPLLESYREIYERYLALCAERKSLQARALEAREREDLSRFQLREIEEASLKPGEEEALLQERKILANASKICESVAASEGMLYSGNDSVTELLGRVNSALSRIAGIDPELDAQAGKLQSFSLELEEIARYFQNYRDRIDFDPQRLDALEERLDLIGRIKKKYGGSVEAALEKAAELRNMIGLIDRFEESSAEIEEKFVKSEKDLLHKASELTRARKKAGGDLSRAMVKELSSLAMGKTRFEARVAPRWEDSESPQGEAFTPWGVDAVDFFIAPNAGEDLKPLRRIASGGELSRILLAMKGILRSPQSKGLASPPPSAKPLEPPPQRAVGAEGIDNPGLDSITYVFDEVDVGIGGAVAQVVGQKLKTLARTSQVICITHLPQIAACADAHYQISKSEKGRRTVTSVRLLDREESEEEIARMLAGVHITEKARLHARELIDYSLVLAKPDAR